MEDVKARDLLIDNMGKAIFTIRWGLVPMYLGLWVAMIAYNVRFIQEIVEFLIHFNSSTSESILLWVLSLIDITMVANLVVMTTIGGYSIFVREFNYAALPDKPRWMNGIDSSSLKIKMGMSLIGVSAVHLLKTFMEVETTSWDQVWKEVLIHVVFIITTLGFGLIAQTLHKHKPASPAHQ